DAEIECVVTLQPVRPIVAGALAAGLHARVGKPLRWFGRAGPDATWQLLKSDSVGQWRELAACLLLADRAGAATAPMVERFIRLVSEQASALPAAFVAPDPAVEIARAEALDRICADLDVQIGITLLKSGPTTISGTRLRGVAEAAGFRLGESGRFDWTHEDSGMVLYSLQNYRSEPFTVDSLRLASTPGAVFILDVPRVADPVKVFDQMKLTAKRMTQTLDATLVDDNRRPLNDASFAAIRQQVLTTADALHAVRVEPGSLRAQALFGG
ncbi:MAG: cell division protein ZipA C-terminal FtsZ-binding domain-containing protein, partial [bacterium]